MVCLAHLIQALVAVYHNHLRCLEALALTKLPCKILRIDTQHNPCHIKRGDFCLCQEVSAVHQAESVDLTLVLCGVGAFQCDERVVFRAAACAV